jgi:FixJ family two-component response regulator
MPEMNGPEIQELLAGLEVPPSIVFMSGHADIPTSVKAMKAGAIDFLAKPFDNEVLLAAVSTGLQDSRARLAAHREIMDARALLERLTPREREVCDCIVRGLRSKEISAELGAAVKTVNVHRGRIMAKLGISSIAELVRLVTRAGGGRG